MVSQEGLFLSRQKGGGSGGGGAGYLWVRCDILLYIRRLYSRYTHIQRVTILVETGLRIKNGALSLMPSPSILDTLGPQYCAITKL